MEHGSSHATLLDEIFSSRGTRHTLYGRDAEQEQLKTVYRRVVDNANIKEGNDAPRHFGVNQNKNELILISGESGVGKTALAQSLQRHVEQDAGFFIAGKFAQMQRPNPHAAFCEALTQLAELVVQRKTGPQELKEAMIQEGMDLETDGKILVAIAPALEELFYQSPNESKTNHFSLDADLRGPLGQQDGSFAADSSAAALRFKYVIRSFVRAASKCFRPVVCLLEDLHWADETSLDLIRFLVEDSDQRGVLYIATYRSDEWSSTAGKNLTVMVQNLNESNVARTDLEISALTVEDVANLLRNVLQVDNEEAKELADIVHSQTKGSIFFIWEVLKSLVERNLLQFEIDHYACSHEVVGNELNQIGGVQELLLSKISQFSEQSVEYLKIAACLGAVLDPTILQCFMATPVSDFLREMASNGFFHHDKNQNSWSFSHDVVQEVTYQHLIPVNERIGYHYRIGRKLWRKLDESQLNDFIFLVVSQLVTAIGHLRDDEEKVAIAYLCLSAGVKGVSMSNFRTALFFFENGITLLGTTGWTTEYQLCLELYNSSAEVANSLGAFEKNFAYVNEVLSNAKTFNDTLRAYAAKVHALGSRGDFHAALVEGIAVLAKLDVNISTTPSKVKLMMNWVATRWRLRRRSIESLLRLPEMTDPKILGAMQMLNLLFLYSVLVKPELSPVVGLKMIEITLDHGISAVSCVGFVIYAYALSTVEQNPDEAYRYGQLAFTLYEKYGAKAFLPRLSVAYFEGVHNWKRPGFEMFAPLRLAHRVGMETGDIEFATLCAGVPAWTKFEYENLILLDQELVNLRERMLIYRQASFDLVTRPIHQSVQNLIGLSADKERPTLFRGEAYNEDVEKIIKKENIEQVLNWSRAHEMILCCLFGEYQRAVELASLCRDITKRATGPMGASIGMFYSGFASVAYARQQKEDRAKRVWLAPRITRRFSRELKRWSVHGPLNFLGKHFFLEAEMAALAGHKSAYPLYIAAIGALREGRLLPMMALANERLAFYLHDQRKDIDSAKPHFYEALTLYRKWGAVAKEQDFSKVLRRLGLGEPRNSGVGNSV